MKKLASATARPGQYARACGLLVLATLLFCSCVHQGKLQVYQKNVPIADHAWSYDFHPSFAVKITDTAARYTLFVTLRHTNKYPYRNLWLLISSAYEGEKPKPQRVELPLADQAGAWLGSGMADIFTHRIPIQQNVRFEKAGTYHFSFEQNMRIDPLPCVMSVGLRIEKVTP